MYHLFIFWLLNDELHVVKVVNIFGALYYSAKVDGIW